MADVLASLDEDDFGDFKSAYSSNNIFDSSLNNGVGVDLENNRLDYFVFQSKPNLNFNEGSIQSEICNGNGFSHDQEHSDRFSKINLETETLSTPWARNKGALPLSIFGGVDESDDEEELAGVSPVCGQEMNFFVDKYDQGKMHSPLAIQHIVSNLYSSVSPQIEGPGPVNSNKPMNSPLTIEDLVSSQRNHFPLGMEHTVLNLYSSAAPQIEDPDAHSDFDERNHSPLGIEDIVSNLYISAAPGTADPDAVNSDSSQRICNSSPTVSIFDVDGLNLRSKELDLNSRGICSTSPVRYGSEIAAEEDIEDVYEWEFKGAEAKSRDTCLISEGNSELVAAFEFGNTYNGFSYSPELSSGFTDLITASTSSPLRNLTEYNNNAESLHDDVIVGEIVDGSSGFISVHDTDGHSHHPSSESTCTHEGNGPNPTFPKGALPLSIFSDEFSDIEIENSMHDVFIHKPISPSKSSINKGSVAIKDIISDLYDQSELFNNTVSTNKLTEEVYPTQNLLYSDRDSSTDDYDDGFCEFKDACSSDNIVEQSTENIEKRRAVLEDLLPNTHPHGVDACFDFYAKLKDELSIVVQDHLKNVSSCEAYEELQLELELPKDISFDSFSQRTSNIDRFFNILSDPELGWLESEYHLEKRLNQVKYDLVTAIQLTKHSTVMMKIITLGSLEERRSYLSAWSEMLCVCLKELKHGAAIWNQALLNGIGAQILSDLRGQKFVLALGEIYRVVESLRVSTKLYKQWGISAVVDFRKVLTVLNDCTATWSSSGIPDALRSMQNHHLLDSIDSMQLLDPFSLQLHGFPEAEPVCRLTLLPRGALPGMRMVVWEGVDYFLHTVNLWANLVSADPPNLPCLFTG